jgi:hypothetical protein
MLRTIHAKTRLRAAEISRGYDPPKAKSKWAIPMCTLRNILFLTFKLWRLSYSVSPCTPVSRTLQYGSITSATPKTKYVVIVFYVWFGNTVQVFETLPVQVVRLCTRYFSIWNRLQVLSPVFFSCLLFPFHAKARLSPKQRSDSHFLLKRASCTFFCKTNIAWFPTESRCALAGKSSNPLFLVYQRLRKNTDNWLGLQLRWVKLRKETSPFSKVNIRPEVRLYFPSAAIDLPK